VIKVSGDPPEYYGMMVSDGLPTFPGPGRADRAAQDREDRALAM
jgi:hypothetical protein